MNVEIKDKFQYLRRNASSSKLVIDEDKTFLVTKDLFFNDKLQIDVKRNINFNLSLLSDIELGEVNIDIDIAKNSKVEIYFADFSFGCNKIIFNINLNDIYAEANFHLASLSAKDDKKEFVINVLHNAKNTTAKVDNFGVCKDKSTLLFAGISHIKNGSVLSKTSQNAKITVFDKNAIAIARPILKIDENDIEANHSAGVGQVNEEHLFYLTSRGIDRQHAKELLTKGYLNPILKGFPDEKSKQEISNLIESRL